MLVYYYTGRNCPFLVQVKEGEGLPVATQLNVTDCSSSSTRINSPSAIIVGLTVTSGGGRYVIERAVGRERNEEEKDKKRYSISHRRQTSGIFHILHFTSYRTPRS